MKVYLFFLLGMASIYSIAQDGAIDISFGSNGIVRTDIDGDYDIPISIIQQADGRLVISGGFTNESQIFPSIVCYQLDGTVDTNFGDNGLVTYAIPEYENQYYEKVLSQSDGKILVGSAFYHNSEHFYGVHRYLPDGALDSNYGSNGEIRILPDFSNQGDMILQGDGSLLVSGAFYENGIFSIIIKRLLSSGALDLNFGDTGTVIIEVGNASALMTKIQLTDDGKIVVLANYSNSKMLLRFKEDGKFDNSFGNNGKVMIAIDEKYNSTNLAIYNDGRIAVSSGYIDYQSNIANSLITRYLSNGELDVSFGDNGSINPSINNLGIVKILVQENQRLLTYGVLIADFQEGGGHLYINRYTVGGSVDESFNFASSPPLYYATDMLLQQDGKIVCLMTTPWYIGNEDIIMKRYYNDPLVVPEFQIQDIAVYPNPSNGIFTVEIELFPEITDYQITDLTGKIIDIGELNEKQTQIDISSEQSGVYFLKTSKRVFQLLKN